MATGDFFGGESAFSLRLTPDMFVSMEGILDFNVLFVKERDKRKEIIAQFEAAVQRGKVEEVDKATEEEIELTGDEIGRLVKLADNSELVLYRELRKILEPAEKKAEKLADPPKATVENALADVDSKIGDACMAIRNDWGNIRKGDLRVWQQKYTTEAMQFSEGAAKRRKIGSDVSQIKVHVKGLVQAKDEAAAKPFIERLNTAVDSECQRIKALHLVMINILHTVIGEDANHEANFKALKKEAFPEEDLKSEDEHWNKAHASELKKIKTVEDHAVLLYRLYKRARQEAKKAAKAK